MKELKHIECPFFNPRKGFPSDGRKEKADRTRSGGGCCSGNINQQHPKSLDVSGRRSPSIDGLHRNLSVTANFLRPQTGVKKETPPGGAGKVIYFN